MKVLIVSEGDHELKGALQALVRRLVNKPITVESRTVRDPGLGRTRGLGGRLFKRARASLRMASDEGFDAVVFVVDQDSDPDRRHEIDRAQADSSVAIHRALGLAIRSFDAWMLADEAAISKVLGRVIQQQPAPEANPDPKATCKEFCGSSKALAELYAGIAATLNLPLLEKRCPKGFAPFADRVRQLTSPT